VPDAVAGDRLFTVAETAVITHSSRSTVRRLIRRGELAAIWVSPRGCGCGRRALRRCCAAARREGRPREAEEGREDSQEPG